MVNSNKDEKMILIIGAGGLLGQNMVPAINDETRMKIIEIKKGELANTLSRIKTDNLKVDLVYYLASTCIPNSRVESSLISTTGVLLSEFDVLLSFIRSQKSFLVFVSSGGGLSLSEENQLWNESSDPYLMTYYAQVKVFQERTIQLSLPEKKYLIIRPTNLFGFDQIKSGFGLVDTIKNCISANKTLEVFSRLETTRNYLYVGDFIAIVRIMLKRELFGIYNVGSPYNYSVEELINAAGINYVYDSLKSQAPTFVNIDLQKFRKTIDYNEYLCPLDYLKKS